MKHILFYLPDLKGGGAERVTVNIIKQLDKNNFKVTLVLVNKVGDFLSLLPPNIDIIDLKKKKTLYSIFKLRKTILKINPDIIYSTLFHTHIALDLALLGIVNKPKIILRSPNSPKLSIENKQLSKAMIYFIERAYKQADKIIAQTPEMKKEIIQYHRIDKNKIEVIINPIDTETINKSIKNSNNPFNETYVNVVASGRLTYQKGFDTLIRAFSMVIKKNKKYRLHIIGEGEDKEKLIKLIEDLELNLYVTLHGFKGNPYIFYYYSNLYVLSSRWEGLPNTVLENIYLKKPIVATKCIPFIETIISNNKNGILVDVDNIYKLSQAILDYKSIDTFCSVMNFNYGNFDNVFK